MGSDAVRTDIHEGGQKQIIEHVLNILSKDPTKQQIWKIKKDLKNNKSHQKMILNDARTYKRMQIQNEQ